MISILGLAGLTCFVLVSIGVGIRLILLATRTKQLPEALVGTSLLLSGGLGLSMSLASVAVPGLSAETVHGMVLLSIIICAVGYGALYFFVWLVFRRDALWGRLLFGICFLMLLTGTVGDVATRQMGEHLLGVKAVLGPFGLLSVLSRLIAYAWAAWESFAYHAMMRRRLALGLAEESLVRRFWYWGVCMFASCLIWIVSLAESGLAHSDTATKYSIVIASLLGFVVAGSLQKAFFSKSGAESESEAGAQPAAAP